MGIWFSFFISEMPTRVPMKVLSMPQHCWRSRIKVRYPRASILLENSWRAGATYILASPQTR